MIHELNSVEKQNLGKKNCKINLLANSMQYKKNQFNYVTNINLLSIQYHEYA